MRPRDLAFEALCHVCGMDWQHLTDNERGRVNAALKQIKDVVPEAEHEFIPEMILARADAFHHVYPEIALTPQALVNHWSSIISKRRGIVSQVNRHRRSNCATCGGDGVVVILTDLRGYDQTGPCPDCTTPDAGGDARPVDRPVRGRLPEPVRDSSPGPMSCALCGQEILGNDRRTMYAQELSWQPVKRRPGGGAHDRGKAWKRTGALAHERCVTALHAGRLNQQDLFTVDQSGLF